METLLTLEQSVKLREELIRSEEKLEKFLENKNSEINQLAAQVKELQKQTKPPIDREEDGQDNMKLSSVSGIVKKIASNSDLSKSFEIAVKFIQGGYKGLMKAEGLTPTAIAFFEANHLILSKGGGMYSLTDLGKDVLRELLNSEYE